jgi:hypothetical protein
MNENLSEMVKDATTEPNPAIFSEADLDLPTDDIQEVATVEATSPVIPITSLSSWFEENASRFSNINQVKVAIRGVDATKTLIMAVADDSEEADGEGNEKRNLRVYENADTHPVLDLTPETMDVYSNGFRILYNYGEGVSIKCYGIRTGLIAVFCNVIEGSMIPYAITRVKRKDDEIEVVSRDAAEVSAKLAAAVDGESLQLRYKQSAKAVADFTTNKSAIDWLLARQVEITDINHHLQIDNIIIDTLA